MKRDHLVMEQSAHEVEEQSRMASTGATMKSSEGTMSEISGGRFGGASVKAEDTTPDASAFSGAKITGRVSKKR